MSSVEELPQDSGSTFGHLPSTARPATPNPVQEALRAYWAHSCGCLGCGSWPERCEESNALWQAYQGVLREAADAEA